MERKIKFRGRRTDSGEWIYGYYAVLGGKHYIYTGERGVFQASPAHPVMYDDYMATEIIPETVGQFTGLSDSSGKEICEGDIFTINGKFPKTVKFIDERAAFCVTDIRRLKEDANIWVQPYPGWWRHQLRVIKVTGNIHDNPVFQGKHEADINPYK
jgi:uncharacterized phage protein (TIGR01671 family)